MLAQRWLRNSIIYSIVVMEMAAGYLMFLAAKEAALDHSIGAIESSKIGAFVGFCFFWAMYCITYTALALLLPNVRN